MELTCLNTLCFPGHARGAVGVCPRWESGKEHAMKVYLSHHHGFAVTTSVCIRIELQVCHCVASKCPPSLVTIAYDTTFFNKVQQYASSRSLKIVASLHRPHSKNFMTHTCRLSNMFEDQLSATVSTCKHTTHNNSRSACRCYRLDLLSLQGHVA